MTTKSFLGINNVATTTRLREGEFTQAADVDISSTGMVKARRGRTALVSGTAAHDVLEADFGVFCVIDGDLKLFDAAGALLRTVYQGLGALRVWYVVLADGSVGWSNGLINGLSSASSDTEWGLPTPPDAGAGVAGVVPYFITYVRISDGREGPPTYGDTISLAHDVVGLPVRAGYAINLYVSMGGAPFLSATTVTDSVSPGPLGAPYVEPPLATPPVGKLMTTFGPRTLIASGSTLWATQPFRHDLCDLTKDFVQLPDPITLVYGVEQAGVFIGTTKNLFFAGGATFETLKLQPIAASPVVLGSAVEIDTPFLPEKFRPRDVQQGALCIVDGFIQLLSGAGSITPLTAQRYRTDYTEVRATARIRDDVLQYLAAPV